MTSPLRLQSMREAIDAGNAKKVRLLLKTGVSPDDAYSGGPSGATSLLARAALIGQAEVLAVLLEASQAEPDSGLLVEVAESPHGSAAVVGLLVQAMAPNRAQLDAALAAARGVGNQGAAGALIDAGAGPAGASPPEGPAAHPLERLRTRLASAARPAFLPEVESGEDDPSGSKFAGTPRLAEGEGWPRCGHCQNPMQLLIQLDLGATPGLAELCGTSGWLQVFYCRQPGTFCEQVGDDAFSPFGRFQLARVHHVAPGAAQAPGESGPSAPLAPRCIRGWREVLDLPWPSEPPARTGVTFTEEEAARAFDHLTGDGPYGDDPPLTHGGDKLLGWPVWLQGYDPVPCPACQVPMRQVLQLASRGHLEHDFGDCGVAALVCCPDHPGRFGFSWAGS